MNGEVFIDASAWVALFWPSDGNFGSAERTWQELIKQDWLLVTTNWTLYEALTFMNTHGRHDWAMKLLEQAEECSQIVSIDRETEESAMDWFARYQDKTWSVVDCANLETIRRRSCGRAFAFDRHFLQASGMIGFQVLP